MSGGVPTGPRRPLFLARGPYRSRRLADAARLLPVLGTFLLLLPILWQPANTPERDTAGDMLYLFGAWAGLIVLAALISARLGEEGEDTGVEAEE